MSEPISLTVAIRNHLMPDDPLQDVSAQYKKLTDKDKADMREWFKDIGVIIKD